MEKYVPEKSGRKNFPGSVPVEGWEVIYFQDNGRHKFGKQFDALLKYLDQRNATWGGVGDDGCKIWLPDGRLFHALSYKGDFEGWRKDIETGAKIRGVQLATIQGDKIVLYNGESFLLKDCKIEDAFRIDD
jgi:hypothetical protein